MRELQCTRPRGLIACHENEIKWGGLLFLHEFRMNHLFFLPLVSPPAQIFIPTMTPQTRSALRLKNHRTAAQYLWLDSSQNVGRKGPSIVDVDIPAEVFEVQIRQTGCEEGAFARAEPRAWDGAHEEHVSLSTDKTCGYDRADCDPADALCSSNP
jgi:hypothetical protein